MPALPLGHATQSVIAPLFVSPSLQAAQSPSVPAVPGSQATQALWSAVGFNPASHGVHELPSLRPGEIDLEVLVGPAAHASAFTWLPDVPKTCPSSGLAFGWSGSLQLRPVHS